MALSADILRGYTDTIILHQLSHGDSYGYQINKTISTLSGGEVEQMGFIAVKNDDNSILNVTGGVIRSNEQAVQIQSYWGSETSGARRRYYAITALGQEKLISDLAAWEDTKRQLDQLLEG